MASHCRNEALAGLKPLPPLPWLSLAMGLGVANLYTCQALLPAMARDWGISGARVMLLPAFSQWGLAAGLLLLLPLGDVRERRGLLVSAAAGSGLACALLGLAPSFTAALVAAGLLGLCSLVAYLLPPFVARLTPPKRLGGVLGTLLAGQFAGVLLSRSVSGALAQLESWRLVYLLAAPLLLAMALAFRLRLPLQPPPLRIGYRQLQGSQLRLWCTTPTLRRACLRQGMLFGAFMALWSALALHLGGAPWGYGPGRIGLVGLVGLLSIALAGPIGRLVDRHGVWWVLRRAAVLGVLSLLLLAGAPTSLPLLVLGMAGLDVAVQGSFVAHQTLLLGLDPAARSRMLTWLVFCAYVAAGLCSLLLNLLWGRWQWGGATGLGLILTLLALLLARPQAPGPAPRPSMPEPPGSGGGKEDPGRPGSPLGGPAPPLQRLG